METELGHKADLVDKIAAECAYAEPPVQDVVLKEPASAAETGGAAAVGASEAGAAEVQARVSISNGLVDDPPAVASVPIDEATAQPLPQPNEQPPVKDRSVTPTYGQSPNLSRETIKHLLAVAGDHTKPEAEWLRACHLLGDYTHKPRRRANLALPIALTLLLLIGAGAGLYTYVANQESPTIAPAAPVAVEPNYDVYMSDLQAQIKQAWEPPTGNVSRRTEVVFNINRAGDLSVNPRVSLSSGAADYDAAALQAVESAAPFAPLPPGAPESVPIEFTLDYNFDSSGAKLPATKMAPDFSSPAPSTATN